VLRTLHDELDRAVFAAYGWADLAGQLVGLPGATTPLPDKPDAQAAAEEELLTRLVALNAARAAEETQGQVHWLRPAYQHPGSATPARRPPSKPPTTPPRARRRRQSTTTATGKAAWPKTMREQIAAVLASLHPAPSPPPPSPPPSNAPPWPASRPFWTPSKTSAACSRTPGCTGAPTDAAPAGAGCVGLLRGMRRVTPPTSPRHAPATPPPRPPLAPACHAHSSVYVMNLHG
jgi:hypothetical protein